MNQREQIQQFLQSSKGLHLAGSIDRLNSYFGIDLDKKDGNTGTLSTRTCYVGPTTPFLEPKDLQALRDSRIRQPLAELGIETSSEPQSIDHYDLENQVNRYQGGLLKLIANGKARLQGEGLSLGDLWYEEKVAHAYLTASMTMAGMEQETTMLAGKTGVVFDRITIISLFPTKEYADTVFILRRDDIRNNLYDLDSFIRTPAMRRLRRGISAHKIPLEEMVDRDDLERYQKRNDDDIDIKIAIGGLS